MIKNVWNDQLKFLKHYFTKGRASSRLPKLFLLMCFNVLVMFPFCYWFGYSLSKATTRSTAPRLQCRCKRYFSHCNIDFLFLVNQTQSQDWKGETGSQVQLEEHYKIQLWPLRMHQDGLLECLDNPEVWGMKRLMNCITSITFLFPHLFCMFNHCFSNYFDLACDVRMSLTTLVFRFGTLMVIFSPFHLFSNLMLSVLPSLQSSTI